MDLFNVVLSIGFVILGSAIGFVAYGKSIIAKDTIEDVAKNRIRNPIYKGHTLKEVEKEVKIAFWVFDSIFIIVGICIMLMEIL